MFRKPFKLKLQVQLKSTEKKKFGSDLKLLFPLLSDEDISGLISNKESITRMKVTTFKEEDVEIYCINKIPMYIDIIDDSIKLPTVFMLWRFPHMLHHFTTTSTVLNKLKNGADLFFPGIYTEGLGNIHFKKNDPVCINLADNKAAVAIGLSLVDKDDVMNVEESKDIGKLAKIYHTVGDMLYKLHPEPIMLELGPPDWAEGTDVKEQKEDENAEALNEIAIAVDQLEEESSDKISCKFMGTRKKTLESEKDKASELLEYCFLKALKNTPKTAYPILPATFYANHVLTNLPQGENLNIKKTKWKKFSHFLQEKSIEGLIKLKQMPKNEFAIQGANTDHQRLKQFSDHQKVVSVESRQHRERDNNKTVIQQVYSVSAATLPFFSTFGLKKHDELTRSSVRNHLNEFIKNENLVHPENPEMVVLDPILNQVIKGSEVISRANLLTGVLDKMKIQHKVSTCTDGGPILHKGKMPLIEFEVCLRAGNKKVTLISNLESYGVNINNFSKELQHKAAASTTVTPVVPGKKGRQLLVQGNQIAVAAAILKEKFDIYEKFMKGLEKAGKLKSKK